MNPVPDGDPGDRGDADGPVRLRQAVMELLARRGMQLRELDHELEVTYQYRPDTGRVYIGYANGDVRWERVVRDRWGTLADLAAGGGAKAVADKITWALLAGIS